MKPSELLEQIKGDIDFQTYEAARYAYIWCQEKFPQKKCAESAITAYMTASDFVTDWCAGDANPSIACGEVTDIACAWADLVIRQNPLSARNHINSLFARSNMTSYKNEIIDLFAFYKEMK